jgi:membrane protein DedA with SNARE-associated domain
MFIIGMNFDKKIVETGRLKFIKIETVMKLEHWFQKWGYWMILINRFLSGTRAVISFFAGMSLLDIKKTTLISFAGAFIWNFILIYSGMVFSENWREIYDKLDVYGYVILGLVIIIALFIFFRNKFKKK